MGSEEIIPIYSIVEAKSINELVKLTNLKTKMGWNLLGGMCHTPNNLCEADSQVYPYCQTIYRMEKPKKGMPVKEFVAFPYKNNNPSVKEQSNTKNNPIRKNLPAAPRQEKNKNYNKNKNYAPRDTTKNK